MLAVLALPGTSRAASEKWKDLQGSSFKAEAVEALGPLGLFRTGRFGSRMVAWRAFSPGECVRFQEQVSHQPERAGDWAQSRNVISRELSGRVLRLQNDKLVPAELGGRPEPEFFLLFFANSGVGKSWEMLGHSIEPYYRLQQAYPGLVEGLFFGVQHSASDHESMARQMRLPWLVADFHEERRLETIAEFAPADSDSFGLVVVNRAGVPVFSAANPEDSDLKKVFGDLTGLLELMNPGNPRSWPDRAYYLRAVQPVIHAADRAEPVLVGNPLAPEGLSKNGVRQVDATIEVAADGQVTAVTVAPGPNVPEKMIGPLGDALKKACVFVAAVDHGKFVAATYRYHLEVPR